MMPSSDCNTSTSTTRLVQVLLGVCLFLVVSIPGSSAASVGHSQHGLLRETPLVIRSLQDNNTTVVEEEEEHDHEEEEEEEEHDHDNEDEEDHEDHASHDDHDDHEEHSSHDEEGTDAFGASTSTTQGVNDKPWGPVILAAFCVNMVTLVGVIFVAGQYMSSKKNEATTAAPRNWKFASNIVPCFACGALLATTVFLIIPESILLISSYLTKQAEAEAALSEGDDDHSDHDHVRFLEEEHDSHDDHEGHVDVDSAVAWRFGVCILVGFLLPLLFSFLFSHNHDEIKASTAERESLAARKNAAASGNDSEDSEKASSPTIDDRDDLQSLDLPINYSLAGSILLGDFFHNFSDGIFMGTAFLLCDRSLAITITLATVYHELAQEIADFFLLTRHCNLRPCIALFLNFVCGLSVLLGALLILAVDISSLANGCILALGGGVYFFVAMCECLPRARRVHESAFDRAMAVVFFALGVVPIGLVLLNHGHCGGH